MITNQTVFILGAGASWPYGYPTGLELRNKILDNLKSPHQSSNVSWKDRYDRFYKLGYSEENITQFRDELSKSTLYSIDAFLENRPEFHNIGKIAIADALIPCEDEGRLYTTDNNWYSYFFNRITPRSSSEKFAENKISFVTFNYDRSLEQYLYSALKNTYGKSKTDVANIMAKLRIIHIYGKVDLLEWQSPDGKGQPYDGKRGDSSCSLKKAADMIRIVHEDIDVDSDPVFVEVHRLLHDAKNIFFLGFGYYETNLDRLKMKHFIEGRDVMGTSLNLESSKHRDIGRYFQGKGNICMHNVDNLSFLHNKIDSLWA